MLEILAAALVERTSAEWQARLDAADIPNGPVMSLEEIVASDYLRETGFLRRYRHPSEGPVLTTAVPVAFSVTPGGLHRPPPRLGEHSAEILAGLEADRASPQRISKTS